MDLHSAPDGPGAGGPGALYSTSNASRAGPVTLASTATVAPLGVSLSFDGPIGGPGSESRTPEEAATTSS